MTVAQQYVSRQSGGRGGPSGLADVLDVLLDKGLVIDAFVRVSLVGIELLTIDARVVIAGVDTYLHFAEAVNRLDLLQVNSSQTVPELFGAGPKQRNGSSATSSEKDRSSGNEQSSQPARLQAGDREDADGNGSGDGREDRDGKGLLSRLVDRGQAF